MYLHFLTANFVKGKPRIETLEGREYIVVPVVMITHGVHAGSGGPLYYPEDELGKTPVVWNHKPIVVYHPEMNGRAVSACDPTVIEGRKIGMIMNTNYDNGKLRAEAWLEKSRMEKVDKRVLEAVEKGNKMEVSTGLFTDNEIKEGEYNGKKYQMIARNYRPDHLAILPDKIGACSIADGAGLFQTNNKVTENVLVLNALSFDNIRRYLSETMRSMYGKSEGGIDSLLGEGLTYWAGWIEDVYDGFFIYCDGETGKLYKQTYSIDAADNVTIGEGEPSEVRRVTEYRTVSGGAFVGNSFSWSYQVNKESPMPMNKADKINHLIKSGGWAEEDRDFLNNVSEQKLDKIIANTTKKDKQDPNPAPSQEPSPAPSPPPAPAPQNPPESTPTTQPTATPPAPAPAPAQNQLQLRSVVTTDEYINNAPPEIQQILREGLNAKHAETERLIGVITTNQRNVFTVDQLRAMNIESLRGLAALATPPVENNRFGVPSYVGAAPAPASNGSAVKALVPPTMSFEKKERKR